MSMILNPYRFTGGSPPPPPLDPDVEDYEDRIIAAGGSISSTQLDAVETFVTGLKSAGIWANMDRLNVFCGTTLTAALIPLKVGSGSAADTNSGLSTYSETGGITGSGSHYVDTGVSITGLDKSDFSMGVFTVAVTSAGSRSDIGSSYNATGTTNRLYMGALASFSGSVFWGCGNLFGSPALVGSSLAGKVVAMETTSTTDVTLYQDGSSFYTSSSWNNDGFQAGTINVFRATGVYSVNQLGGYFIGNNLDQSTLQSLYTTFKTAIGR